MARNRFSIEAVFKAVDRVTAPVNRMQNRISMFTRSMRNDLRGINDLNHKLARGFMRFGKAVAVGGVAAGTGLGFFFKSAVDFQQAMADIQAIRLTTPEKLKEIRNQALELGRATRYTATEVAQLQAVAARMGLLEDQILATTRGFITLAAASGEAPADVTNNVLGFMKSMDIALSTENVDKWANAFSLASTRVNATVGSLAESMSQIGFPAQAIKWDPAEMIAAAGLLQDFNLDASVAGTAIKRLALATVNPSGPAARAARAAGVKLLDENRDVKPLFEILEEVARAQSKIQGTGGQLGLINEMFAERAGTAATGLAIVYRNGRLQELSRSLKNVSDEMYRMERIRMNTVLGGWFRLTSAIDGVKQAVFELNQGPLQEMFDGWAKWINENQDDIVEDIEKGIPRLVDSIKWLVKHRYEIGMVFAAFAAFATTIKTLAGLHAITTGIAALLNPVAAVTIAILAVAAAVAVLVFRWEKLVAWFDQAPRWARMLARVFMVANAGIFLLAWGIRQLIANWEPIKEFFSDLADVLTVLERLTPGGPTVRKLRLGVVDYLTERPGPIGAQTQGRENGPQRVEVHVTTDKGTNASVQTSPAIWLTSKVVQLSTAAFE